MAELKIFSADSHVSEPGDLWEKRIDKEFRFRAPYMRRLERDGKMQDLFFYEGFPPHPVGVGLGAAQRVGARPDAAIGSTFRDEQKGYNDALPGGWNPEARLKDQDIDGVEGELLHCTIAFRMFWMRDAKPPTRHLPGLQRLAGRVLQLQPQPPRWRAPHLALRCR